MANPLQPTDSTPELYGGPKENPIGSTEAELVRAARAAVAQAIGGDAEPELQPNGHNQFGGDKVIPFPVTDTRLELPETARETALIDGFHRVAQAGVRSLVTPSY